MSALPMGIWGVFASLAPPQSARVEVRVPKRGKVDFSEWHREHRLAKLAAGLCAKCKKERVEGKTLCEKHLADNRVNARSYQGRLKRPCRTNGCTHFAARYRSYCQTCLKSRDCRGWQRKEPPPIGATFGFWEVIGHEPRSARGSARVRVRCTGCNSTERVHEATRIRNYHSSKCLACAQKERGRIGVFIPPRAI